MGVVALKEVLHIAPLLLPQLEPQPNIVMVHLHRLQLQPWHQYIKLQEPLQIFTLWIHEVIVHLLLKQLERNLKKAQDGPIMMIKVDLSISHPQLRAILASK